jgi:hypothetical protein
MPTSTKFDQHDLTFKYPGQPRTDGGQFDFGKLDVEPVAGKPPPPKQPAPPTKPAQPVPPSQPTKPLQGRDQKTEDILKPGGQEVGVRSPGAGSDVRTVNPAEYKDIKDRLLDRSREISPASGYAGRWFERPYGTVVGIRQSPQSGETIDLVNGQGRTSFKNGYRIHQQ